MTSRPAQTRTDPEFARLEREEIFARAMRAALSACSASETLLAALLHTRPRRVAAWRDPRSKESIPAAQLMWLAREYPDAFRPVVRLLAEAVGASLSDVPTAHASSRDRLAQAAACVREGAEAHAKVVALATHEDISDAELSAATKEIDEGVEHLLCAKADLIARRRAPRSGS